MIAMAVYDTAENGRTKYTKQTLEHLLPQIKGNHRLFLIDNASCQETKDILSEAAKNAFVTVITNNENVGTAKAINQAWKLRNEQEYLIKMDNDCIVYADDWIDQMEECFERMPKIGILGLKRKDLLEDPNATDAWRSILIGLPHKKGQRWINVEEVGHVMGTCQMYNWRLIDEIGGLYQMDGIYGFDDSLASIRCSLAGYGNCFLPHIEIDHIDEGGDAYTKQKQEYAGKLMERYNIEKEKMKRGELPIEFPL